jgi:oligoendopeptidase F
LWGKPLTFFEEERMKKLLKISGWGLFLFIFVIGSAFAQTNVQKIPQRSDIPEKYKWKLEDIYPSLSQWEKDFSLVGSLLPGMEKFEGHLAESGKTFLDCMRMQDSVWIITDRLYVYANLKLDEDNRVSEYQELSDRVANLYTSVRQATSFIEPEITALPEGRLSDLIQQQPGLAVYQHYFDTILRRKAHILSAPEEALLAQVGNVARIPRNVFTMLDDADIKYPVVTDEDGHQVQLTKERYSKLLESTNRQVRKEASDAYNQTYLGYINTLGATLSGSISKDIFYARAEKYNSCLEASLFPNNIPVDVYDNLIKAVDANLEPIHKYVRLRKQLIKVGELHKYDLWVPLVPQAKMEIPYDSAVALVMKAVQPLGKPYVDDLRKGFNSRWVDVYETEGKGSGAYSWGAYTTHPYMLLNYNGSLENVFTVAHEMGHNMHRLYSNRTQPYIYADCDIFVCEVASTFNEALLMDYLLKHAKNKEQKLYLLNYYIDQIMGTFYSQVMFSEFEEVAHQKAESGEALSAASMRKIYKDIFQKYYGPELVLDSLDDLGCLRISHFYREFYVYKYATSFAASSALSRKVLAGDKDALNRYLELLKSGDSDYPVELLKKAGVDMTTPEPVNETIKLFGQLVDEMEKLLEE